MLPVEIYFGRTVQPEAAALLFFVAARLIKIHEYRAIWRSSRLEFALTAISLLGVVLIGVEQGLAIAVGLAIIDQTWRSAHPRMVELGRRKGTTSWEPLDETYVEREHRVLVVLFDEDLFFANAGVFRRELHDLLKQHPHTRHVVVDAVAISEVDFTGLTRLAQVVADLVKDDLTISFARADETTRRRIETSQEAALAHITFFDSTDAAVQDALHHHTKG